MKNKLLGLFAIISVVTIHNAQAQNFKLVPEHIPITDCTIKNQHLSMPSDSIKWFTDTLCSHTDFEFLYVDTKDVALKSLMDSTLDDAFYQFFITLFEDELDTTWNFWLDSFLIQSQYHAREIYVSGAQYWLKKNYIDVTLGMYDMTAHPSIATVSVGYDAFTGGAHAFRSSQIFNFDVQKGKRIQLEDCFSAETLPLVEKFAYMDWTQNDPDSIFSLTDYDFFLSPDFIFDELGLHLLYDAYEIGPYVMGDPEIIIPLEICRPLMNSACTIAEIYK